VAQFLVYRRDVQKLRIRCGRATPEPNCLKFFADLGLKPRIQSGRLRPFALSHSEIWSSVYVQTLLKRSGPHIRASELEMRYPDALRAAPWIVLAATVLRSVAGPVLFGLAQRFTSQEKNNGNSLLNAPRTTPMRPAVYPTKFAELSFLLLLGAAVAAGIDARAAQAFDAAVTNARAPDHLWCVTHEGSDVPAACEYGNFLTCSMAAIMAGGSCKERLSLYVTAGGVPLPRPRRPSAAKLPLQKRASALISGNDDLFRKFVRWSNEAQLSKAQSTTIVASAEPGAVVIYTKPALSEAEPTKPEPAAINPNTRQAHAPGEWLIQIGAFDDEAEARQHLSEARLKVSTALAAAEPFTERVQTGDRVLYRARFAGFDKETAEIACTHLKRGHFECMALKK
jgi:cell division septation protein DedD